MRISAGNANAHSLVFVSAAEGFGYPIVEAMTAGCPVVTSNISSMPEIAGDAGLLVDPNDATVIADAIIELNNDGVRAECIGKGRQRAAHFSFRKQIELTRAIYSAVSSTGRANAMDPANSVGLTDQGAARSFRANLLGQVIGRGIRSAIPFVLAWWLPRTQFGLLTALQAVVDPIRSFSGLGMDATALAHLGSNDRASVASVLSALATACLRSRSFW